MTSNIHSQRLIIGTLGTVVVFGVLAAFMWLLRNHTTLALASLWIAVAPFACYAFGVAILDTVDDYQN